MSVLGIIVFIFVAFVIVACLLKFLLVLVMIILGMFMSPEKVCDAIKIYLPFLYTKVGVVKARERWKRQEYPEDY